MKDKTDIDALIHFAKNTAKSAGEIIKKYRNSQEYGIKHKATELDLVTEADIETDNFIINQIRKTYPSHQIMTEESYKNGEQFDFKRPLWIIDPIDGTSNFVYGLNDVAVSIGYMEDFEIKAGVIYLPFLDELFWATKGNGAYLWDKRISVRNKPLKTSLIYLGISAVKSKDEVSQYLQRTEKLITRCKSIRNLGSSATELANIANGLVQGKSESNHPWDVAAGVIIVKEAGGMTGSLDIPNPEREKLYYMKLLQTNLPHELYTNNFVAGCSEMFDEFVELLKS